MSLTDLNTTLIINKNIGFADYDELPVGNLKSKVLALSLLTSKSKDESLTYKR